MYKITQRKKAQSALEFLTTYGWAFLVILIMIGALAYFGVLDPGRFLPDRCQFQSEIGCQESVISGSATDTVQLRLINNVGNRINLTDVEVTSTDTSIECDDFSIDNAPIGTGVSWPANNQIALEVDCTGVTTGDRPTFDVSLEYTQAGSNFVRTTTGVVSGRAN